MVQTVSLAGVHNFQPPDNARLRRQNVSFDKTNACSICRTKLVFSQAGAEFYSVSIAVALIL
jgi:hypothetical protein